MNIITVKKNNANYYIFIIIMILKIDHQNNQIFKMSIGFKQKRKYRTLSLKQVDNAMIKTYLYMKLDKRFKYS